MWTLCIRPLLSIFLLLSSAVFLLSCQGNESRDVPIFDPLVHTWPHDLVDIEPDPAIRYGILDNGLRYALSQNSLPEKEAAIRFWIKAGARHELDDELGVAHFLEHMAFNGSENIPEGELIKDLERLGLKFGADSNASTSFSRTIYKLNLPNVDTETVDYGLRVLREMSDKLLIEADAVERERGVVMAEENRSNNVFRAAQRASNKFFYEDAFMTKRPTIGTPESLKVLSAEQLREFYDNHYRPERAFLVMVGDFNLDDIEAKIRSTFADWHPDGEAPPEIDLRKEKMRDRGVEANVYKSPEISDNLVMMSATDSTSSAYNLKKYEKTFRESIATSIVNRRLAKKVLDPDSPVRSARILYYVRHAGDQRIARATPKDKDWQAAIEILNAEIKSALEYGFQEVEYEEVLADMRRATRDAANNIDKRKSIQIAEGILSSFSGGRVNVSPETALEQFEAYAKATTLEDIEQEFIRMFSDFEPLIWLQGKGYEEVSNEEVIAAFKASDEKDAGAPEVREKKTFAYTDFGPAGKTIEGSYREDFEIESLVFDNNVRLHLKKTDFKTDWVNIVVNIGEGTLIVPTENREIIALGSLYELGGFEAHPVTDLKEIFAGKKINTRLSMGSEKLAFSSALNPEDLLSQLQVWTAMTTAPGYREGWKTKFDQGRKAYFQTKDSTPGGVARQHVGKIWADNDPRLGVLPLERYLGAQPEDFKQYFHEGLQNGAIEIGIVGDFDRDQIVADVAKTFGALDQRRPEFRTFDNLIRNFPKPDRVELFHKGKTNEGAFYMAWPIAGEWDHLKGQEYEFIRRILQNRMIETVRENLGLSYSPSIGANYPESYSGYGYVSAAVTMDPKDFTAFEKAAKTLVADMRSGNITADEVDRVRQPALEKFERTRKENSTWVGRVASAYSRPEEFDRLNAMEAFLDTVSHEQLNLAVQTLFDPDTLHIVSIRAEEAVQ